MNSRGQHFAVFRLLIGAILGVAILVIIIGIIGFIQNWEYYVSDNILYEGLDNAVQTPNGDVVVRKNLKFPKGNSYAAGSLAANAGLEPECLEIQATDASVFALEGNNFIKMQNNAVAHVYYQCFMDRPECDIYCIVSFGKALEAP
ncbi:MAG: hypothetical protein JW772_02570 [Candidatus Diapherotrites archaeon]|nr:hypothetical protein [Candidatus Diapherotrites archaeon]